MQDGQVLLLFLLGLLGYIVYQFWPWLTRTNASGVAKKAIDMTEKELYQTLQNKFLMGYNQLKENGFPRITGNGVTMKDEETLFTEQASLRKCKRCKDEFYIDAKGNPPICRYHSKGKKRHSNGVPSKVYSCCLAEDKCKQAVGHVPMEIPASEKSRFVQSPKQRGPGDHRSQKIFALDCEMIYTEKGMALARLSVVDFQKQVVMNDIIEPNCRILDYNTEFSGISQQTYYSADKVFTLEQTRTRLFNFINSNTILVGHGLHNDLIALRLVHNRIVDTAILYPDKRNWQKGTKQSKFRFTRSLKELARVELEKHIQESSAVGHCSEEDAITALQLTMKKIDLRSAVQSDEESRLKKQYDSAQNTSIHNRKITQPRPRHHVTRLAA